MEIKVGMYVRGEYNFGKVKEIISVYKGEYNSHDIIVLENGDNPYRNRLNYTKQTPQELIQEGDMIVFSQSGLITAIVVEVSFPLFYARGFLTQDDEIQEIWTRTSDDTYTRQWVKE